MSASTTRKLKGFASRSAKLGALLMGLFSACTGCALVYPELSTPIRTPSADAPLTPEPPADLYYLYVTGAHIPHRTRDGREWDKGKGAAPDVYAILFVNQVEVLRTSVVPDSFEPTWTDPNPVNYRIDPNAEVRVELWDENALVAHPICTQLLKELAENAAVGKAELNCDSGATIEITLTPPKARLGMGLYYEQRGKAAYVTRVIAASSAGRAGIRAGDRIISVRGRLVSTLTKGELESLFNANALNGLIVDIQGQDGRVRKTELNDEAMYPVQGEGISVK